MPQLICIHSTHGQTHVLLNTADQEDKVSFLILVLKVFLIVPLCQDNPQCSETERIQGRQRQPVCYSLHL
jgi:hypothetical protein